MKILYSFSIDNGKFSKKSEYPLIIEKSNYMFYHGSIKNVRIHLGYTSGEILIKCIIDSNNNKLELQLFKEQNQLFCIYFDDNYTYSDDNMVNFMAKGLEILKPNSQQNLDNEAIIEYYHAAMKRMEKLLVYATEQYEISFRGFEKINFDTQNKSAN